MKRDRDLTLAPVRARRKHANAVAGPVPSRRPAGCLPAGVGVARNRDGNGGPP